MLLADRARLLVDGGTRGRDAVLVLVVPLTQEDLANIFTSRRAETKDWLRGALRGVV